MVNKAALGILVVIMLTAVTIGALVGLQLGGGGGLAPAGTSTPTPEPAATSTPVPTATPTPTPTGTPTATPYPSVPPEEFDERDIEDAVVSEVNALRAGRNESTLNRRDDLTELARFHSDNMAAQGFASHAAGGYSSEERYERFDVGGCRVPDDSNTGLRSGESLETVAKSFAGRPYEVGNETRVNTNESMIAGAVVEGWMARNDSRLALTLDAANGVGVGANLTDDGSVYVTVNLC